MNISDINSNDISLAPQTTPEQGAAPINLSDINPNDIQVLPESPEEAKFGESGPLKATLAGAARGATFGLSDVGLTKTGLVNPETLAGLEQAFPGYSALGGVGGAAGLGILTGGLSTVPEAALTAAGAGPWVAKIGAEAGVGALFGAGNVVSDKALGDPDLNAQKIISQIGFGTILGAGIGTIAKAIPAAWTFLKGAKANEEAIESAAKAPETTQIVPTSLVELDAKNEAAKKLSQSGGNISTPAGQAVDDALSRLPMQNPPTPYQRIALDDEEAMRNLKVDRASFSDAGKIIRASDAAQRAELLDNANDAINNIAKGYVPTPSLVEGGNKAGEILQQTIQDIRDEEGPQWKALKKVPIDEAINHQDGLLTKFVDAVPKIGSYSDTDAAEPWTMKPWNAQMGSKTTYNAVKTVVDSLKENPGSFDALRNIRESLRDNITPIAPGSAGSVGVNAANSDITRLMSSAMDYIQAQIRTKVSDLQVRDIFKRWAINEQNAGIVASKLGIDEGKPLENVFDKIFHDTETVKATKNILGDLKFRPILADYMSSVIKKFTDPNTQVFKSGLFSNWLNNAKNQSVLQEAFETRPELLQKFKDIDTLLRLGPDIPTANPSGTASTLWKMLVDSGMNPLKWTDIGYHKLKEAVMEAGNRNRVNLYLSGQADKAKQLSTIGGFLGKSSDVLSDLAEKAVNGSKPGVIKLNTDLWDNKKYNQVTDQIKNYSRNPQSLMNDMSNSQELYRAAPNITQSLYNTYAQGIAFLNSKIPHPPDQYLLSQEWEPSSIAKRQFGEYYKGVDNPLSLLADLKSGYVSPKALEACQAVHPNILNEMKSKVLENIEANKAQKFPLNKKMALSNFLGQPLDANLTPQHIMANQTSISGPQLSQQSAPQQGRKTNLGGLKQLNQASRTSTRTSQQDED